ncbi:hypothetical protein ACIA5D_37000 [Actinoplanes sp. NPDC051513]|uniref:hypothetical protein n=1 Tax=Actinoplanes sp. NPDC051513 TaxID=3363908 RepID=UPI0037918BE2
MPVQVSSDELRAAACMLRDDAAESLRRAAARLRMPGQHYGVDAAFDRYTTDGAYREYATAVAEELSLLERAAQELAADLEQTAHDYDAADARAAQRTGRGK